MYPIFLKAMGTKPPKSQSRCEKLLQAEGRATFERKGITELDCKIHLSEKDENRPKSSHQQRGLTLQCQFFTLGGYSKFQGLSCSLIKTVRDLDREL